MIDEITDAFDKLLELLSKRKSDQRTPRDRVLAILITEIEKVRAYWIVYGDG